MAPLVLLLSILAQQQFPPESPPIQPTVRVLWMTADAPQLDLPPADAGQPVKVLRLGPANVFASQAEFNAFCANLDTQNNIVYTNAWATEPPGSIPGRVTTTGCIWLSGYTAPNNQGKELNDLQISMLSPSRWPPGFTPIPGVSQALRDQYHGDQVTMYDNASGVCGLAYINAALYGKDAAIAIVTKSCADSNYSDVHERGHNMGMCHDTPNASGCTPAFDYGYGFCDSAHSRRDPMVYPSPCGGSRVGYFGNPDDTHFGYAFGNSTHNNAAIARWAMPIMANFYPPTCTSTLTLAPTTLPNGSTGHAYSQTFTASGGTGPYTFTETGTLPTGLSFTTATLSGTPTTAGTSSFTVSVADTTGCGTSLVYSLTILGIPTAPTNLRAYP